MVVVRALVLSLLCFGVVVDVVAAVVFAGAARADAAKPGGGVHFVYVVRHGDYDPGGAGGLNEKGHRQAKLVGERLASSGVRFDRLVSSELLRAQETADDMGAVMHLRPVRDALLNECLPTSIDAALLRREGAQQAAACDEARALEWTKYFVATPARDTFDVLVSHGNVIRWLLLRALGGDTKLWPLLDIGNASVSVFAVAPNGAVHVVSYDDVGHLPPALQTFVGRGVR